jgi:Type I phosphodiesterase / nucleotide pyrophosphatase
MHRLRVAAAALVATAFAYSMFFTDAPTPRARLTETTTPSPIERACGLDKRMLVRLWRGFDRRRSEDIVVVPKEPNYLGSFQVTSHTGPWDYVQQIPLVFYGPPFIHAGVASDEPVNLVDVYPTIGELLDVELPSRAGSELTESLKGGSRERPALIVVVMWDGVGNNVLSRWPDKWPNLMRLSSRGTSYTRATVGSSPSITPASHSSLVTGAWPRAHRVTAIRMRIRGHPGRSFRGLDPHVLAKSTFADEVDRAFDNRSKVALVGWQTWHLGMLGHGLAATGGDRDVVALIRHKGRIQGNQDFYSTPDYLSRVTPGLERRVDETDRADGAADGRWLGHDVAAKETPAWVAYQTDVVLTLLRRGQFGVDSIPDLLMVNFKMTDVVGHLYTMDSPEMAENLAAQDEALGKIVRRLESMQRDFVLILSADHGHTPAPEGTGAWPISQTELIADLDRAFATPDSESLVEKSHAAGFFLDRGVARRLGIGAGEIARWLNDYRLADNSGGDLPSTYTDRASERLFSAAFVGSDMGAVIRCAFGSDRPPPNFHA